MSENFSSHEKVLDSRGNTYYLSGMSWEGGQGKVIIDKTGRYAIKLLKDSSDPIKRKKINRQIQFVSSLPLDQLPVSKPLATLRPPFVGYVMEYLTGMVPLSTLIDPPREIDKHNSDQLINWYIQTGGINRRLIILAKLATALNQLHSKGLVYGDLSPNNVFISSSPDQTELRLIDLDNLCSESSVSDEFIFTPYFGAPEVYNHRHGIHSLSDAFSFAVIVFMTLALSHPLIGDMVVDGDPELEAQAQLGELPWIYHQKDNRNRSTNTLPKNMVFSNRVFQLLESTFTGGLTDRDRRPGLREWEAALHKASRFTLECPQCKWSYFYNQKKCSWCAASPPRYLLLVVDDYALNSDNTLECLRPKASGGCYQIPGSITITRRVLDYHDDRADIPFIELEIDRGFRIQARALDNNSYWVVHEDWKYEEGRETDHPKEPLGNEPKQLRWMDHIHIGKLNETHPVVRFVKY